MNLNRLAALQKRILDWREFFDGLGVENSAFTTRAETLLGELKLSLAACWEKKEVTAEAGMKIEDLESALEALSEEARLTIKAYTPLRKEKTFGRSANAGDSSH